MRVGPVGWAFDTKEEVLSMAKKSAECTHNHPEGIKGAQATALAIMMARQGCTKEEIRSEIEKRFEYNLQFTCDEIRPTYTWGGTCQDSVPQAIVAFLDGKDFEDSVRNAISIGGDSDTIGVYYRKHCRSILWSSRETENSGHGVSPYRISGSYE